MAKCFGPAGVERVRVDTKKNLCDVCDKVHELSAEYGDGTHVFTMSRLYEELLLHMGEKKNDGGQLSTPRDIIRAVGRVVAPQIGETAFVQTKRKLRDGKRPPVPLQRMI